MRFLHLTVIAIIASICLSGCKSTEKAAISHDISGKDNNKTQTDAAGSIGQYSISKKQLEHRLRGELLHANERNSDLPMPLSPELMLKEMLFEKAMIIEGRNRGYLEQGYNQKLVDDFRKKYLYKKILDKYVKKHLEITDKDIQKKMNEDPTLEWNQAEKLVTRERTVKLLDEYHENLLNKYKVNKYKENYSKIIELHGKLKSQSPGAGRMTFVRVKQVAQDLTDSEKSIVLASFDDKKITSKDWFYQICDMSPPSRPDNLNTPAGVDNILDNTIKIHLFVHEAVQKGLSQTEEFRILLERREEKVLLHSMKYMIMKQIAENYTDKQLKDLYESNKELFKKDDKIKIRQMWCSSFESARKAREAWEKGEDFNKLQKEYCNLKWKNSRYVHRHNEGIYFDRFEKASEGDIIGPIKGVYKEEEFKWRVLKITEKKSRGYNQFNDNYKRTVKSKIWYQKKQKARENLKKELFKKYNAEINEDVLDQVKDPLELQRATFD